MSVSHHHQSSSSSSCSVSSSGTSHKPCCAETLDHLIEQLYQAFESDHVDVDYITDLMESYKSVPSEWKKFAKFDRYKYTRNLVDEGNGKFDLMLLCWGPSQVSNIHDHADAHCFMKVLSGNLEETRYEWPKQMVEEDAELQEGMNVAGRGGVKTNEVCYINDSLGLHRVSNPSDSETAVSLHLYCPPFSSCQLFDERTGNKTKCPITFYSKYGQKIKYCQNN